VEAIHDMRVIGVHAEAMAPDARAEGHAGMTDCTQAAVAARRQVPARQCHQTLRRTVVAQLVAVVSEPGGTRPFGVFPFIQAPHAYGYAGFGTDDAVDVTELNSRTRLAVGSGSIIRVTTLMLVPGSEHEVRRR
jgi:hypothetical protein